MTNILIEAVENELSGKYEITLRINSQAISIKFDNGASQTIISASEINANLTDDKAEQITSILSARAEQYKKSQRTTQAPFQKQFVSASGDTMTGYLVEAKNVRMGDITLDHFYYYLIPQNKRSIALLGNDFLRYCEYTHKIEGNIYVTKMDIEAYEKYYSQAISIDELVELIDEMNLSEEIDGLDTVE